MRTDLRYALIYLANAYSTHSEEVLDHEFDLENREFCEYCARIINSKKTIQLLKETLEEIETSLSKVYKNLEKKAITKMDMENRI